ncbi:hypothetical protein PspLS_08805 [Pyricularia sp. CBS 133598]|nr:hypothetical protein PspLS_08805 [Pyricularia sp. CBS 133598]
MRFFKLATVLAVAASGVQALAVARDVVDNQAVHVNSRRNANTKLVAHLHSRGTEGTADERVPPLHDGAGSGSAPPGGRRQKFRETISTQWDSARNGWGPKAVDSCKCAAQNAWTKCKCAAKNLSDKYAKKPATGSSNQPNIESKDVMGATAAPKTSVSEFCKSAWNRYGESAKKYGCKATDWAREKLPGRQKSTKNDEGLETHATGSPHAQKRSVEGTSQGKNWQQKISDQCKGVRKSVGQTLSKAQVACQDAYNKHGPKIAGQCTGAGESIGQKLSDGKVACQGLYQKWAPKVMSKKQPAGEAAIESKEPPHQNSRRTINSAKVDSPAEGIESPAAGLKRTSHSWNLAELAQSCQAAGKKLIDGVCAKIKGTPGSSVHQHQQLPQEDPESPIHSPRRHPGSPTNHYQQLPQEDQESHTPSPRRHRDSSPPATHRYQENLAEEGLSSPKRHI